MDRPTDRESSWFDEVLQGAGIDPARLARVDSTRRPVVERNNPWNDPDGIEDAGAILEAARGQDSDSGRIVFVTDVDEDPIARVQAAVHLGRAAVARGLDVLLVDADVRHVGLSRWLPDRDLDAEGLVDVLQYGASVSVARRASAIGGIDVLGIGSYRPDASEIYGADDLRRLVTQLRLGAALVLLVGPARLLDGRFHPLLSFADGLVLSMHLDPGLAASLGEFLTHLHKVELPLSGAFVWAGPDDPDKFVEDALLERSRALPPITLDSPFPGRGKQDPGGAPVDHGPDPEPSKGVPIASPVEEEELEYDDEPRSVPVRTERPKPGRKRKTGTSGLVRGVFVVLAIGIVGFVGWWALTWRSVEPTRPRVRPAEQPVAATTAAEPVADSLAGPPITEPVAAVTAGSEADPGPAATTPAETTPAETTPAEPEVETSRNAEDVMAEPVESAPAVAEQVPPRAQVDPFEAALKRSGDSGWGLHLFSFPSESEADADRARLERQGYSAVVREATIKGERWYRVVVGQFDTKAAAAKYRTRAQEKFRVDWVGVVRR